MVVHTSFGFIKSALLLTTRQPKRRTKYTIKRKRLAGIRVILTGTSFMARGGASAAPIPSSALLEEGEQEVG